MQRLDYRPRAEVEPPNVSLAVVLAGIVAIANIASAFATLAVMDWPNHTHVGGAASAPTLKTLRERLLAGVNDCGRLSSVEVFTPSGDQGWVSCHLGCQTRS